jgi:PAS domain S-box-containing protein
MDDPGREQENPGGPGSGQSALFRSLFENNPLPMWIYDVDTLEFLEVNDAAVHQYGFTRDEFLSMTVKDIRPPEEVAGLLDMLASRATGFTQAAAWTHRRKDGTLIDVEVTSHGLTGGARKARFVLVNDVTGRKRTEEALRRSEEKYRDLFENANDAIFIVDSGQRYLDVNKKAVELLGYSKEELLTMKILDLIPPEQAPRSAEEFEKLRDGGSYEKFVGKIRTKDGLWLDVEVSSSAIITDGRVTGSRDIMRNITDRKRMEEELLRAQKLESVGILAGGIAHDFNNLLTAILGNITLAKLDAPPGEGLRERLSEAEKATYRAQDLTQQLLTFSKGGAPVKKTVSIKDLIEESVSFSLRGSKTLCIYSIPDNLWPVEADEGQMSQVFNNLVINADQAMPDGGKLRIFCSNVALARDEVPSMPAGRYVKTLLADRGIGIPKEHIEKIFDPYFTTKQRGSGLGLATCYSIVKRHGGHIGVESELGAGAMFHVYLPASEWGCRKECADEVSAPRGAGRILVVDDEEMIRDVVRQMLSRQGYETACVSDGQEALQLYGEAKKTGKPFHAVLMDLTIPGGMGGREAMRKLAEIDPKAKVIVSSGYSNDPIMAQFRDYGFSGVVSKPFTIAKLSEVVQRVIDE